jgi:hypothetical protein
VQPTYYFSGRAYFIQHLAALCHVLFHKTQRPSQSQLEQCAPVASERQAELAHSGNNLVSRRFNWYTAYPFVVPRDGDGVTVSQIRYRETAMEQNARLRNKEETVFPSGAYPAYSTEERLASPLGSSSSWFAKGRKRRALVWGITSTALSAVGLIALALFEQYNGMLSELRTDLKHFNETASEYVKKDKLQKFWDMMKECSKEIDASNAARAQTERELKASERAREDMAKEMQRLRERLAFVEGMKMARPDLQSISHLREADQD